MTPMPAEMKKIQNISPAYIKSVISKISRMDRAELMEFVAKDRRDGGPNMIEMAVASVYMQAVQQGDHTKLNFLMDRSVGKVIEEKRVQLQPVTYRTSIAEDGRLVQEVIEAELAGGSSED